MPSTFTAIACRDRDTITIQSTVRVFQTTADGRRIPVAHIRDFADPADHRRTEIIFSGGRLEFGAAYDGPVRRHTVLPFTDENGRETGLELHDFPYADQSYLGTNEGFFPIKKYRSKETFSMTVCRSSPVQREDGMLYPALATITQTGKTEDRLEYRIRVEEKIPLMLLAAIFSLPFTLLNID